MVLIPELKNFATRGGLFTMALRRLGYQPTETDPTLDIGAKRARVVGEDESSTQVQLRACARACMPACMCSAYKLQE